MIRQSEAIARKKQFLLCRVALAVTTGLVGLGNPKGAFIVVVVLMLLSVLTSALSLLLDPFLFFNDGAQSMYVIADTATVFAILMAAEAGLSHFIPFFVVLGLTAKIENVFVLTGLAVVIASCSAFIAEEAWSGPASLPTRIPFIVSSAIFYWIVVLPERQRGPFPG